MKKIIISLFAMMIAMPVFSATEIREAVLSEGINERNPFEPLSGTQICGNENNPASVNSAYVNKIYLWNRVNNDEQKQLIHSWQKKVAGSWNEEANINLNIGVSFGWRTWSSKNIDPHFHKGDWRVVITTEEEPENVLCVVNFSVN